MEASGLYKIQILIHYIEHIEHNNSILHREYVKQNNVDIQTIENIF